MDPGTLPPAAKAVLILLMAIGGGAGSTAGGLKLLRLMILFRFVQAMFYRISLPPHAVSSPRLAGHRLGPEELREATIYLTMGLLVVGCSWFFFLLMDYDPLDSLFEVVSATGTVGLSTGISGPQLPLLLKGVLVGVVMFFIMAFQEISTAIFLYRGGWETLPIGIFLNWHRGMEFGIAAAMAFLMIVITFILLLIISRIGGGVLKAAWGSGEQ